MGEISVAILGASNSEIMALLEAEEMQLDAVLRHGGTTVVLEFSDVPLATSNHKSLNDEETNAVIEASQNAIENKLDAGPFESVIDMLARRVFANTYKRE